jgi:GGDEF domain-containing protein
VDFNSTGFPLAIVSTDTTALRELSWTLSAYGYQALATSDWSEQAPWRRVAAPTLLILDARDEQQIEAALASARSTPYSYRIALYDGNLLGNPDMLMDLGADDLIRYPLNAGELMSCLRRGARRLEFEKRFNRSATFDQQRGVANRRGFTLQMGRKLKDSDGSEGHTLVVLGIDFLDTLRDQHGSTAVENACSLVADMIFSGLTAQDCRGVVEEGVFAVLLHDRSVSDGLLFANEVNEQFAAIIGKGIRISLSGIALGWPSGETAEVAIQRATAALDRIKGWGGKQILDLGEVEREYTAWNLRFAGQQATDARQAMEAFPLVLPLQSASSAGGLGITSFTEGYMPPCLPIVDDVGHLVGVIDKTTFRTHGNEVFNSLDEHLESIPATLRGDSGLDEIVSSLESAKSDYMLVVENKKPIGYVTNETVAALRASISSDSDDRAWHAVDCGLNGLIVPLI